MKLADTSLFTLKKDANSAPEDHNFHAFCMPFAKLGRVSKGNCEKERVEKNDGITGRRRRKHATKLVRKSATLKIMHGRTSLAGIILHLKYCNFRLRSQTAVRPGV